VPCCPAPMSYSMFITCALLEQINDDDDDDNRDYNAHAAYVHYYEVVHSKCLLHSNDCSGSVN